MQLKLTNFWPLLRQSLLPAGLCIIFIINGTYSRESLADKVLSDTFVSVVKETVANVVNIRTSKLLKQNTDNTGFRIKGQGSGVIYDRNGYIITNNHVVKDAGEIIITLYDGREFKAESVGTDARSGVGILKINAEDLTPARFGNSDSIEIGEIVLAVGNTIGLGQTVTYGIISAKGTSNIRITGFEDFLQTDAAINPDSYGGPLVNLHGEVVGISTIPPKQTGAYPGINIAIPANVAREAAEDLITHGKVTRGWLGVVAQPITTQLQKALGLENNLGTLISDIEPDSPAANAGIKSGDVIISYNGIKINDLLHLRSLVARTDINKDVEMVVLRDGEKLTLNAAIVEATKDYTRDKKDLFKELGLVVQNLTPKDAIKQGYEFEKGVIIADIRKDSPAFKAGLNTGDLIIEVQHKPVTNIDEFHKAILKIEDDEDILMFIRRQKRISKFVVIKQKKDV